MHYSDEGFGRVENECVSLGKIKLLITQIFPNKARCHISHVLIAALSLTSSSFHSKLFLLIFRRWFSKMMPETFILLVR